MDWGGFNRLPVGSPSGQLAAVLFQASHSRRLISDRMIR